MPRTKGSLNKKGKQSLEERKANRKASRKPTSAQYRQTENEKRKIARREKKIEDLNLRIKNQRQELYNVGRFSGDNDPALKQLGKILDSTTEEKLAYVSTHSSIVLDPEVDLSHLNRMTMMVFHCQMQHKDVVSDRKRCQNLFKVSCRRVLWQPKMLRKTPFVISFAVFSGKMYFLQRIWQEHKTTLCAAKYQAVQLILSDQWKDYHLERKESFPPDLQFKNITTKLRWEQSPSI
jgi:hypothetical protein